MVIHLRRITDLSLIIYVIIIIILVIIVVILEFPLFQLFILCLVRGRLVVGCHIIYNILYE